MSHPVCARRTVNPPHLEGTVTYRIEQLIKQDLAERIPDPSDSRGYLIRLTAHGLAVIECAVKASAEHSRFILDDVLEIPSAGLLFVELLRAYEHQIETTKLPRLKKMSKRLSG